MDFKDLSDIIYRGEYEEAKQIIAQNNNNEEMGKVYLSRIKELQGKFNEALMLANDVLESPNSNLAQLAATVAAGYAHWRLFNFDEGINLLKQKFINTLPNNEDLNIWYGSLYNITGLIYWKDDKIDTAMKVLNEALRIREMIGDDLKISYTLNNLGNCFLKQGDLEEAEKYYTMAKNLRELVGYTPPIAASHNSFGRLYDKKEEFEIAEYHHQETLELWREVGNVQYIAKSYRFLGINAALSKKDKHSRAYFDKSDQLFKQIPNPIDLDVNKSLRSKYLG